MLNKSNAYKASAEYLESEGWTEYSSVFDESDTLSFYKKFATKPSCSVNGNGIQLKVQLIRIQVDEDCHYSWVLELCAINNNQNAVSFRFYALSLKRLESDLDILCGLLIAAWQAANK